MLSCVICPLPGTFITTFVLENPRADNIMMLDFTDCAGKCLRRPWRIAIVGSDQLVTELSMYTSCTEHCQLTTFYIDLGLLTSNCMLLAILLSPVLFTFLNEGPGPYFQWLQLMHRGVLTGVCVAALSQPGVPCMKSSLFGSIHIE